MIEESLVSIGIPTFNRPKGLKRVLHCFLAQTYGNIEIIVSDNCSEDEEVQQVIKELEQVDSRIRSYKQPENRGMFENFRFVLQQAKGEFFMWASDDDEFHAEYVSSCLKPFAEEGNIVLVSPICKVFRKDEERMLFKPDFDTVGLSLRKRIAKISKYIKKSHSAMYGLFRTEYAKKVHLETIIDADGLFLYELCRFGYFHQLKQPLMRSTVRYAEKDVMTSLTFSKSKMIDAYNIRPKYMWKHHENITLFLLFIYKTMRWPDVGAFEKIRSISSLYRSFFGYNTIRLLSIIRTALFWTKKKRIHLVILLEPRNEIAQNMLLLLKKKIQDITVVQSLNAYYDYEVSLDSSLKDANEAKLKSICVDYVVGSWTTRQAQSQHALDYLKAGDRNHSHCIIGGPDLLNLDVNEYSKIVSFVHGTRTFNRALRLNDGLLMPLRAFVDFNSDYGLNIKVLDSEQYGT